MMQARIVEGRAYPLGRANIDTDLIIGARHLKTVSRVGLGRHAFETLRGDPANLFDRAPFKGAPILIAGDNFGCGSSREHAAWALRDLGIRAVVAPSFADIFAGNAFRNGIITVELEPKAVERLMAVALVRTIRIDLAAMAVTTPLRDFFAFSLDPFRRTCLIEGLDEIALTLTSESAIRAYELRRGV
jgi:3-isopropylmalate/(R)-2-methylmalate dehydratase small subunit